MLNSLKPPTDNLYKFISIAGLVCFVLGVVLSVQTIRKTLGLAYAGEDALQEAWLTLGEGFQDGDDETAFGMLNETWKKAMRGEEAFGLTQEVRKLGTLNDEQLAAVRRFEIAAETLGDQNELNEEVQWHLNLLTVGSLAVLLVGFFSWYRKTQRHLDLLLRMQTEEQTPVEQESGAANAYRKWTPEEEEQLRKGFGEKKSYKQLADSHGRSRGAIKARLLKLELIEDPKAATQASS